MQLRLLAVLAHPDDESLALGGVLARYAAEGVEISLLTATSGEQGWPGDVEEHPGVQQLARIREAELRRAAEILGIRELRLLRYPDGRLATADPGALLASIAQAVRQIRPDVVVTFGPDGATGHPDHVAIGQLTTGALVCAADPTYPTAGDEEAHRVAKLYYLAPTRARLDSYDRIFGDSAMIVDGLRRTVPGWPEWSISAGIGARHYAHLVWDAISCHRSQLPILTLESESLPEILELLGGVTTLYRVYSLVNPVPHHEVDLFAGLRDGEYRGSQAEATLLHSLAGVSLKTEEG